MQVPGFVRSLRGQPWPLLVLAAPATVAVWSGWVGLGTMTGFGAVRPLPGIADDFTVNTAITLPIGVEAYGAYALGTWLSHRRLSRATRIFAGVSSIGALLLGMAGQVAYHLLEVEHQQKVAGVARDTGRAVGQVAQAMPAQAPAWIVTIVACFPVLVLGMGATLAHLIRRDAHRDHPGGGGTSVDLDAFEEWVGSALRDHPESQVTAEVEDPWDHVESTPGTTPAEVFGTTPGTTPGLTAGTTVGTTVGTTPEPTVGTTPPVERVPSRATPSATPRPTVSATVGTTPKGGTKSGPKRAPKGGTKRRTRAETKVELQRLLTDLDADKIQVKPLAEELGASRRTVRDLLDEMNVRPVPAAGTGQ